MDAPTGMRAGHRLEAKGSSGPPEGGSALCARRQRSPVSECNRNAVIVGLGAYAARGSPVSGPLPSGRRKYGVRRIVELGDEVAAEIEWSGVRQVPVAELRRQAK